MKIIRALSLTFAFLAPVAAFAGSPSQLAASCCPECPECCDDCSECPCGS